jgi:hypothetical protein
MSIGREAGSPLIFHGIVLPFTAVDFGRKIWEENKK